MIPIKIDDNYTAYLSSTSMFFTDKQGNILLEIEDNTLYSKDKYLGRIYWHQPLGLEYYYEYKEDNILFFQQDRLQSRISLFLFLLHKGRI